MTRPTLIDPFLGGGNTLIVDGGLATELEARGHALDTPLWSADLLLSDPEAIRDVHLAYLDAGADCIITASYQASIGGLRARGLSSSEAKRVLRRSVDIAVEAREIYLDRRGSARRIEPLVAASIGPYGASLANGSEYTGDYDVSRAALRGFHQERWNILEETPADLFACETIPSYAEAEVLKELIEQSPERFAWISFSCRDGERISDGTPLVECSAMFENLDRVVAVGVNCTAPALVTSLIDGLATSSRKPVVVYPNSGETWDARSRTWIGSSDPPSFASMAREWREHGAALIGGCCRIGPEQIRALGALRSSSLNAHEAT